ncbi:tyrosine-protein phosphatase [Adhaeribacter aquaticus]|uniref:tyrosine-protein phosphatase n=1 Tax=Adhaeribacter aquaticus TaxID=299567 RepID=UPI0003FCE8A1|nr:CpsB/CapC family capsule biosynthesis tyrosine phosphatase [Adhaeribacter aquaticus]
MLAALKKIFAKSESTETEYTEEFLDFSDVMVDMHSHVLPGLDDGSDSLEYSLGMVEEYIRFGYKKLIMTPHIMGDFYKNTPTGIRQKLKELQNAVKAKGWDIELNCAAEYYLDEWFLKKLEDSEELLTFGDNYLLFETSFLNEPFNFKEAVFALRSNGYKPVLAHPERYTYLYGRFDDLLRMRDTGVLFQININSLIGYYSEGAKRVAEKLVDQKLVEFIGTDAHHNKHMDALVKTANTPYFKKVLDLPLRNKELL